jgi:hypothetical protein
MYVYCGGVSALPVVGVYSFPISINRTQNYPLLVNGGLNPSYNPNEAEEVIVAKWATSAGVTITRTSRAWSMPDYDDFIIYEYEMENTGDTDGNPSTPARQDTLTEFVVSFSHGFAPGKTGHERKYNRWTGSDFQQTDVYARFDRRRWLNYTMSDDGLPDPQYFSQWAASGVNGGGLQAPMTVGYAMLYYDTTKLALKTETVIASSTQGQTAIVWDANNHLKQPYLNRLETSLWSESKFLGNMTITAWPRSGNSIYSTLFGPDWNGRVSFNVRQSWIFGVGRQICFGPYILKPGDKIRFALAEVAGYGAASKQEAQSGLTDEGGSCGQQCNESASTAAFNPVPSYYDTIRYGADNKLHGSTYLSHYPLPQYVNSKTVTVRDVTDRAIQMYTGSATVLDYDSSQYWPERSPDRGVYTVPINIPSPNIAVQNSPLAHNKVLWGPAVETFTTPRLIAPFSHYRVSKSSHPVGPWQLLDSVGVADPRFYANGTYTFVDTTTKVLESWYYSVQSVDGAGNISARTISNLHTTNLGGKDQLETVYAVPNPYLVNGHYKGAGDVANQIGFVNLPKKCTIRILSYSGQLIETINHDDLLYSHSYFKTTRNNQVIASGVYFFVVETPDGKRTHGKFVVIQ